MNLKLDGLNPFKDESNSGFLGVPGILTGDSSRGPITGIKGSPFANGGIIPGGFPNDNFPARLTSGEEVVSVSDRKSILEDQGMMKGLLQSINSKLDQPIQVTSQLTLNEQTFADILLEIDRDNRRTTAA